MDCLSSVQSLSHVRLFATPWTTAHQASLFITNSRSLLKLMSIKSVMPSNHLILCYPFLLLPSILTSIRDFLMSHFFISGGQSIGASASASVLPMNIQDWFPLGLTGLMSLQSKRLSRVFSNTTVQKHQFFGTQLFLWSNSHIHTWLLEKPVIWLDRPLSAKQCICFLICCLGLSIAFLPKNKRLLISWLQSPSAVILEPKKVKSFTVSIVSPMICRKVVGPDAMIFIFWMLSFKPAFSHSSFTFIKRLFSSSPLFAIGWYYLHIWGYWYFSWQSWFQLCFF